MHTVYLGHCLGQWIALGAVEGYVVAMAAIAYAFGRK